MEFTSFAGNKRTVESDVARQADFNEIPIISLNSPKEELLEQLKDACTRVGFLYIKDHGVPQEKIDALFNVAENFFAQDSTAKNAVNYKMSKILRGYEPPAEVRTDETRKPDMNEAFNWGYEKSLDPLCSSAKERPGKSTCILRDLENY
jgi:isopenicillin N synthase-like dioxygenase